MKLLSLLTASICLGVTLSPATVRAQCVSGAQCSVTDGSTETRANESFTTNTAGGSNAALVADNHSTIHGTDLTIAANGTDFYGAYVHMGGNLTLHDSTITGSYGVLLDGGYFAPSFSMTGGSITASEYALRMDTNSTVNLTGVNITSSGINEAVNAQGLDITLNITGGSITAANAHTAFSLGSGNTVNLTDVDVSGGNSFAIYGSGTGGTLNMTGGSVTSMANQTAVNITGTNVIDGTKIVSAARGINLMDGGGGSSASLLARNIDLQTTLTSGNDAIGLAISGNASATVKNSSIRTQANGAYGIWVLGSSSGSATVLHAQDTTIETFGNSTGSGAANGISNQRGTATLVDVDITTHGNGAYGLYSDGTGTTPTHTEMTGGSITVQGSGGGTAWALRDGSLALDGVTATTTNNGYGVFVFSRAKADIRNNSTITTAGANGIGLLFIGTTAQNTITVEDSSVHASESVAVVSNGGTDLLDVSSSTIRGDRLVLAGNCVANCGGTLFGSKLEFRAKDSQLFGHASVAAESRLWMNFKGSNTWTIRPSTAGMVQSAISELTFDGINDRILFDQNNTGLWQSLTVGSGTPASSTVYHVLPGATPHIRFNTLLNAGGALSNQFTDRLLINGDAAGDTTLIHVNAAPGSPGGWTSPGGNFLATEGISLIQVSGSASEGAFALDGGYTTVGGTPYLYTLHAYGPGASNGSADEGQRLVGNAGDPFWDWRLQSTPSSPFIDPGASGGSGAPMIVPQAATFLTAPTALFQMGLLDIGSLHRRLGEGHRTTTPVTARTVVQLAASQPVSGIDLRGAALPVQDEAFLRGYGGDYHYRSDRDRYGYDADIRYAAVQGGGSLYGVDTTQHRMRFGLAASVGNMTFEPRGVTDSQKTRIHNWSVSPTFTWQNAAGTYVDTIVSYGRFKGNVSTQTLGKTATLHGNSLAASVEAGVQIPLNGVTLEPQVQAIYQRLKFKHTWANDRGGGFPVELGKLDQWTLRAGGLVRTHLGGDDHDVQVYAKAHVAHTLGGGQKVWMGDTFQTGKSGTVLETGLGVDAALGRGKTRVYGDVIRSNRLGRAGNQGWALNLGVRVLF